LDWLIAQSGLDVCKPHEHGDSCRGAGLAIECGIPIGALEAMTIEDVLDLPTRYLELDHDERNREQEKLREWMDRDRPGARP
jgi:hypothetical protein